MIPADRHSRDRLLAAVQKFLDGESTAFQFSDEKFEISTASKDPTVRWIAFILWHYYDDITDHRVLLTKPGWDHIQRLMLVLRSDAHIEHRQYMSVSCIFAIFTLLSCVTTTIYCWLDPTLWKLMPLPLVPFGIISVLLQICRPTIELRNDQQALMPFANISELRTVRRSVPDFQKHRWPASMAGDLHGPSPVSSFCSGFMLYVLPIFIPCLLLEQVFPEDDPVQHVRLTPTK